MGECMPMNYGHESCIESSMNLGYDTYNTSRHRVQDLTIIHRNIPTKGYEHLFPLEG